jgi:hypothetical protein
MILEQLKKLSLNELIVALQDQIISFSRGLDKLINKNKQFSTDEIAQLRDHIKTRLETTTEKTENEKLLKLVNLFNEDKKALDLMRKDVDDWLEFLDAVDEHIGAGSESMKTEKTRKELIKLRTELRGGKT